MTCIVSEDATGGIGMCVSQQSNEHFNNTDAENIRQAVPRPRPSPSRSR